MPSKTHHAATETTPPGAPTSTIPGAFELGDFAIDPCAWGNWGWIQWDHCRFFRTLYVNEWTQTWKGCEEGSGMALRPSKLAQEFTFTMFPGSSMRYFSPLRYNWHYSNWFISVLIPTYLWSKSKFSNVRWLVTELFRSHIGLHSTHLDQRF